MRANATAAGTPPSPRPSSALAKTCRAGSDTSSDAARTQDPARMALSFRPTRYDSMPYRRCGRSGLQLPALSLGFWQNFGEARDLASAAAIVCRAFDCGITHFDLANNYGPPPGAAE